MLDGGIPLLEIHRPPLPGRDLRQGRNRLALVPGRGREERGLGAYFAKFCSFVKSSVRVFRVKPLTTTTSHTAIKVIQLLQVTFFCVKLIALSTYTIKINPNCIVRC